MVNIYQKDYISLFFILTARLVSLFFCLKWLSIPPAHLDQRNSLSYSYKFLS